MRFLVFFASMVLATHVCAQEAKGVPPKAPSQQEGKNGKASDTQPNASEPSIPVRIVESPEETQRTRDREGASDKHESDDLKAQQRAADSADRSATAAEWQVITAWWQVGVGISGILALLVTIGFTIRATNAAVAASNAAMEANKDARELFASEQRPWLALKRPEISASLDDGEISLFFSINAENTGNTPAFAAELKSTIKFSRLVGTSNIAAVREFAESIAVTSSWENDHKVIFPGKKRGFWEYIREDVPKIHGVVPDTDRPSGVVSNATFVRVIYCVFYRANGIDKVLTTAGEVIFNIRSIRVSDNRLLEPMTDVEGYTHYGVGFAS
jgi:hypothetical protein